MTKKLSISAINKANKSLDTKKKITILNEYEVNINQNFRDSEVDKVVFDYLTLFEEARKNREIDEDFIRGTGAILHTLILREFSDVPMIPASRDVKEIIKVAKVLYDTGIMSEVITAFNESEIKKVYSKLETNSKRVGEILGEYALSSTLTEGESQDDNSQEYERTGETTSAENK